MERVILSGDRYVSLQSWARSRDFRFHWDKANKQVELSNRWAALSFTLNSKKASINRLTVWLNEPVLPSGAGVYVSEADLQKTIQPILYPEKHPRKIRTVAIAAGHGGKDPGYQIDNEAEKKYALLMARALRDALQASGFHVLMVRNSDVYVERAEQAARANRGKADLFITLHYNAAIETEANGVETYCLTPAGAISTNGGSPAPRSPGNRNDSFNALLAYQVHRSIVRNTGFQDRGMRRANFEVLRTINMPGILIEGGFMSNRADARRIYSPAERKKSARAIADGILSFKRLVERK